MFQLRPYQNQIIHDTRMALREHMAVLIVSPTASGKTALTATMIGSASKKGKSCFFTCHRRELILQSSNTFDFVGIKHGIICSGFSFSPHNLIQICGIQTLGRRLSRVKPPDLIIIDECSHLPAKTWSKVFHAYPDAKIIGLTAVPQRLDGKGLADFFSCMVSGPSVKQLIDDGYLSKYRLFAPPCPDLKGVHIRAGDYIKEELESKMDKSVLIGNAVKHYRRLLYGKRALIFAVSIKHSEHIVAEFNANQIPSAHVDGNSTPSYRDEMMARFRSGDIKILSNCEIFTEGVDVPQLEGVILMRPTQSLSLYLQMIGRALRLSDGKSEAIILDHAGNTLKHGLPCDDRQWSLEGITKKPKDNGEPSITIHQCPKCYRVCKITIRICPECQYEWKPEGRLIKEKEGELQEVSLEERRKQRLIAQGRARTLEELTELGKVRGYKKPQWWALQIKRARERNKKKEDIIV